MKTLRLWVLPDAGLDTRASLRRPLALFHKQYPDCRVEIVVRRLGSLWTCLMGRLKRPGSAEGAFPDVVEIPSHWTSALAYLGLLEDLSDLGPMDLSQWLPELRPQALLEGTSRVFSMPWWMEVQVLYYRQDWLRRRGLDGEKDLADWEGLRRVCRKLAALRDGGRHLVPLANSNARESVALADVAASVWSRGGDFFSEDGAHSLLHREELVSGVRAYLELLDRGWMPFVGKQGAVPGTLFEGRGVLQFSGRYPRRLDPSLSSAVRAVETPAASSRVGITTSYHVAVPHPAQNPKEAFDLASCLAESASTYAEAVGGFACGSAWSEVLNDRPDLKAVFERAYRGARRLPNRTAIGSLEHIFERATERLLRAVLEETYQEQGLREELLYAKAEMDYVLSMSLEPAGSGK